MQKALKYSRIVISIFMLLALGFLFLDFNETLSSAWYRRLTWLQVVPSFMMFLQTVGHGLAVTAYGFIVVLILTLLFGRVYCSYICPLGIFQDVISWCSVKVRSNGKRKFRFRFAAPKTKLRYSILILVLLSLFTGSLLLLNTLEPYSNFGRFITNFFRPLYILCNNLLVKIFEHFGSYALYPVTVAKTDPLALLIPVIMFGIVGWLSVRRGRLFCNTVCPGGTVLGLISKVSFFKIRFDTSNCNQCGKCMFVCKSQCINVKSREIDFDRCVGCGNCINICDKNAIHYTQTFARKRVEMKQSSLSNQPKAFCPAPNPVAVQQNSTDISKRNFIFDSVLLIATLSSAQLFAQPNGRINQNRHIRRRMRRHQKGADALHELGRGKGQLKFVPTHVVTPPGSQNVKHFKQACTACHLCVSACPTKVLQPSFLEHGLGGMMQPYMDYDTSFCNYECTRCSEICPNGAILPLTVDEKRTTQIGVVQFEKRNCVVYIDETSCGSCSEHCPTKAVRMVPYKGLLTIPEITPEICVGCGACEYACPSTPYKAIVVNGHPAHETAKIPEETELESKPLDDFPF